MGQKVSPRGIRIGKGLPASCTSVFFAEKQYANWLLEDYNIRKFINEKYGKAHISNISIQRISEKNIKVIIFAFKPKFIIGEEGKTVELLKAQLAKFSKLNDIVISVNHISKPGLEAGIVAYNIAKQIENYTPFRMALKRAIEETMRQGAKGIKVSCSGRVGGAEIARTESYKLGRIPLHTLRADIDYAQYNAKTKYGIIGIKVWIYKDNTLSIKKFNS